MVNTNKSLHEYLMFDVFQGIEGITSKHMFGGFGYYLRGVFFGFVSDGKLFFKVGDSNKKDYENKGSKPFVYKGHNGKQISMSYYEVPADILEDKELLAEWIENSLTENSKKRIK